MQVGPTLQFASGQYGISLKDGSPKDKTPLNSNQRLSNNKDTVKFIL